MSKKFISTSELADALSVHRNTVINWVRSGILPKESYIEVPFSKYTTYRFNLDAVVEALGNTKKPTEAP